MTYVRPKKHLGQHFLTDQTIAQRIADGLTGFRNYEKVLEIGPGTGVLTSYLVDNPYETWLIDVDKESIDYLNNAYPQLSERTIFGDFLKMDLSKELGNNYAVIGNFPYNISSQIFFKILDNRNQVPEVVCMIQKEVAERIASPPGSKQYGILSVLLQAYYDIKYLFTVKPGVFNPPPKVNSGVIRFQRNNVAQLDCDEVLFKRVVKAGFQMRRKTLRNALKPINLPSSLTSDPIFDQRAETLTVQQFIDLTKRIESCQTRE
ncbi:16S rRNA (adenine(1518)-N(6)/adenine(1519)-N(6))-dimethyltransferase RsmA [Roseivirga pacifica]|uniref:16S rRNA (adenine(1518)-N(6)/adenine(1519)-N(6))- dimethyltransferase RsmA n=1 Tax=Roseivirga pacifica TaxID=1267423 RepID=UPI0020960697|nr:16S rRNA (adenine(1518)-N(6)/adenine(1519)-N(6))-dimethyltransferase RsmA [Roseivirga pacifica]MCO6357663.1 16S rRNA (adenine(1518)-N(6)/adenine(1519)-N(6))-dimethyltransferase RsmA [Roseivirga pacifica]MCO6365916.1 16S rRNA (adenine(1518)-N(6)/adenine(1519)-N(6))-dimethyltransferase RsmA [Roseivirga pacifica]MCO6371244.1 16S rRNA (adenine(1518)-N(6)/adenine(1519)-N(6))-dimethyltransferase RsmA [Roseivirga pacifica]MCO6375585.1 16S rRNA (adenine(1518)-N(6)/adenine(1519)-N(6))-dimethyltransfe